MNGILQGAPGAGDTGSNLSVKQGATQTPLSKVMSQITQTVFPTELKPITYVKVHSQGSTNDFMVVSHYGPCADVPDNHDMPGMTPYQSVQQRDDFNLPIAGSPAPGQKAVMFQTQGGDSMALGTTTTSPPGVTSPGIPNTGDVTPGTAATNPAEYVSAPVPKQHPWITDVVAGDAMDQEAYGKYDYTDPTGAVHPSLGKGDTRVKKPKLNVRVDGLTVGINGDNRLYVIDGGSGGSLGIRPGEAIEFDPSFPPSTAPTLALDLAAPGIEAGLHKYAWCYTYTKDSVFTRTGFSAVASISTDGTHGAVDVTTAALDAGSPATGIEVYRTAAGDSTFKLVGSYPGIDLSVPHTFTDSTPDAGLGASYAGTPIVINALYDGQSVFLSGTNKLYSWRAKDGLIERPGSAPATALTATLTAVGGTGVDAGLHNYAFCWYEDNHGHTITPLTAPASLTFDSTHTAAVVTIPAMTAGEITRGYKGWELYRSAAGGTYQKLATGADTGGATVNDSASDASLSTAYAASNPTLNINLDYKPNPRNSAKPYNDSGFLFDTNADGSSSIYLNTGKGLVRDYDPVAGPVTLRRAAYTSIPAVGVGAQTAALWEGENANLFDGSSIGYFGDNNGFGVRVDGVTVTRDNTGALQALGTGGGSSAAARVSLDNTAAPPAMAGNGLPQGTTAVAWTALDFDSTSGSMWSASHPTRLVATSPGLYQISAGLTVKIFDMTTISIAQGFKMSFEVTSTHTFGWNLGGTKVNAYPSATDAPIVSVGSSVAIQLGTGDYVELLAGTDYTNLTNPAAWQISGDEPCWFSLIKCG